MTYQPAPYSQLSPTPTPRNKRHLVRNSVFAVIGLGVVIGIATSASSSKHADAPAKPASPGVSKGIAAKDASADVTKVTCSDAGFGLAEGKVAITNHSSKRSDYFVTVVFIAADGTHRGEGLASSMGVEGGQRAVADLTGTASGKWMTCKVTEVQRTAS